jgi:hypothetical protein
VGHEKHITAQETLLLPGTGGLWLLAILRTDEAAAATFMDQHRADGLVASVDQADRPLESGRSLNRHTPDRHTPPGNGPEDGQEEAPLLRRRPAPVSVKLIQGPLLSESSTST